MGAIGDLDTYLLPDARGAASLSRHLTDDRDDLRQQMREEILGTTRRHFTEFADVMAEAAKAGTVCVLGGSAAENAATEHGWSKKKAHVTPDAGSGKQRFRAASRRRPRNTGKPSAGVVV